MRMKRLIGILLIAALLLPMLALHVSTGESQETTVRVRLSTGDATSLRVTLSGKYSVDGKTVSGAKNEKSIIYSGDRIICDSNGILQQSK